MSEIVANEPDTKRHVKNFNDLNFTVVAEVNDYRVEYKIYDVVAWEFSDSNGRHERQLYVRAGAHSSGDIVESMQESEVYLSGHVKWDGCSNWNFDEQERCMLHGCGRAGIQRFGDIMAACWDWTAELCPNWID